MRPTVLRAAVVLAAASLVAGGLTASSSAAAPVTGAVQRADDVRERKTRLDREIDEIRKSLEGTSQDLVDAAVALKRAETELVGVRAELDRARAALAEAERRDAALAADLAYAQAEEKKAVDALAEQADQEQEARTRLGRIAREAYVGTGMTGLSIALQADTPDQFTARMAVAGAALRSENSEVDRLVVVQAEMRARTAKLTALRARTAELKKLAAAAVVQRQEAEQQAAAAEAEQTRLVDARTVALGVIKDKKEQEQARLAEASAEQSRLAKILRDRAEAAARKRAEEARNGGGGSSGGGGGGGGGGGNGLSYPVSAPVTSGFGMRYHPVLHYWRLHAGTDFGAACGTPVRAAASGVVVRAGWAGGYGNQIVVDHGYMRGKDVASSYNHLSRIVARGRVSRGEVIGYSGTTGLSTGCHLHFEVYENGTHVDPMRWL